jgi:hypothetical protein
MDEQDLNSEMPEVAPHETDHDVSTQSEQDSEQAKAQARADANDRNWQAMRQRQKELELEIQRRDELLDRVLKNQTPQAPQPIPEPEEPDDEFVPAGKVKGIARKTVQPLEKKIADLEAKLAQQEQQKLMQSLHSKYPDFDDVVNVETLGMLEKNEPELATTIAQFKDPYKMGLHAYKYIKALNLVDQLPDARHKKEVIQKLEKNAKAVQSPTAYDKRPMAQAFKSTQADSKKLYEEMMFYAGQASGL